MSISTTLSHSEQAAIIRLYGTFERKPDTDGLAYWYTQAEHGMSLHDIAVQFVAHPEWNMLYGSLTPGELLREMYHVFLGRAPDPGGFDWWLGKLENGLSHANLILGFTQSQEYVERAAAGVEQTLFAIAHDIEPTGNLVPPYVSPEVLGTEAGVAVLELSQLVSGTTPDDADMYAQYISAFQAALTAHAGNAEAAWTDFGQAVHAADPTNAFFAGTDVSFVTNLHQSVYGSAPSAAVLSGWMSMLSEFEQTIGPNARGALLGVIAYTAEKAGTNVLSSAAHTVLEVNDFVNWGVSLLDQHPQVVVETVTVTDTVTVTETVEVPSPHVISFGSDQIIDTSALNAGGTASVLGTPTRMVGGFDQTDSSQFGLQVVQGGSELVPTSFSWSGTTAYAELTVTDEFDLYALITTGPQGLINIDWDLTVTVDGVTTHPALNGAYAVGNVEGAHVLFNNPVISHDIQVVLNETVPILGIAGGIEYLIHQLPGLPIVVGEL